VVGLWIYIGALKYLPYYKHPMCFKLAKEAKPNTLSHLHHKLPISQNFNRICAEIIKWYLSLEEILYIPTVWLWL
jgi:hypothetical protein